MSARDKHRAYYERHPDRCRQRARDYYARNRETVKARSRAGYARDAEQRRKNAREYYARNREEIRERRRLRRLETDSTVARERLRRWRKNHPVQSSTLISRANNKRRARESDAFVEEVDPAEVLILGSGICGLCDEALGPEGFHVDHIVPLSKGGEYSYANTQPAHATCNLRKGST